MYKILLVDDEALVRDSISRIIPWEKLGYELLGTCGDGKEAMDFVKEHPVDVVLTDICMPFADGIELSRFLYESYPAVKVIIFSGHNEFEYAKKAVKYQVVEYILKPVTKRELSAILLSLKESMDEEQQKQKELDRLETENYRNKMIVRNQILSGLVAGGKTEQEYERELSEIGLLFTRPNMKVGILDIELEYEKENSALYSFVICNIAEEILVRHQAGIAFLDSGNRIYMIFQSDYPREFPELIERACRELQEKIIATTRGICHIGIGRRVHSIGELYRSCEEAGKAAAFQFLFPVSHITYYEDTLVEDQVHIEDYVSKMAIAVKSNSRTEIGELLGALGEECRSCYISKSKVILYIQQVVMELRRILEQAGCYGEEIRGLERQLFHDMDEQKTMEGALEKLIQYCMQSAERLSGLREDKNQKLVLMAQEYIEKNYQDSDLNLNQLCTYLAISPSHFSSLYKVSTGETFLDTLNRIRMDKARYLLEHTAMKNYEIAEQTGYQDPHYFSVAFKKATGMTPKEYAREKRKVSP